MSRPKLIAGNWKMNPANAEGALDLLRQLKAKLAPFTKTQIAVMPPFTMLPLAVEILKDTRIAIGAQNLYWEDTGAFTGGVSAPMLKSAGCQYVIIGHSERRQYFGETNETVHRKVLAALNHSLKPIVCVGETLKQRETGLYQEIVKRQITEGLAQLKKEFWSNLVIAYEPVWAIGTGKTATPAQAQEMHAFIRDLIVAAADRTTAENTLILYGGSVNANNARDLLSQNDIDGALVGGASLKADAFAEIVRASEM